MQPRIAFGVAAAAEILIVGLIAVGWPAKAAEGAVPIAILACGLASLTFPGPWYRVSLLGAVLGLLNAGFLILLSSTLGVPETFSLASRLVISTGFGAATATATWLWTQYERQRGSDAR